MGYENIDIFEKEKLGGGIPTVEIGKYKSPLKDIQWEI